jgi:hypothetical protein
MKEDSSLEAYRAALGVGKPSPVAGLMKFGIVAALLAWLGFLSQGVWYAAICHDAGGTWSANTCKPATIEVKHIIVAPSGEADEPAPKPNSAPGMSL